MGIFELHKQNLSPSVVASGIVRSKITNILKDPDAYGTKKILTSLITFIGVG